MKVCLTRRHHCYLSIGAAHTPPRISLSIRCSKIGPLLILALCLNVTASARDHCLLKVIADLKSVSDLLNSRMCCSGQQCLGLSGAQGHTTYRPTDKADPALSESIESIQSTPTTCSLRESSPCRESQPKRRLDERHTNTKRAVIRQSPNEPPQSFDPVVLRQTGLWLATDFNSPLKLRSWSLFAFRFHVLVPVWGFIADYRHNANGYPTCPACQGRSFLAPLRGSANP